MLLFLTFINLIVAANSAKILFLGFTNSKSHVFSMLPFAQTLVKHGHDVTIYAEMLVPVGELGGGVKGHWIVLQKDKDDKNAFFNDMAWNWNFYPEIMLFPFSRGAKALGEAMTMDSFWTIANQTWDLIVSDEIFTATGYGLALLNKQKHGKSHAVFSTTDTLATFSAKLSLNQSPATAPSYYIKHEPLTWEIDSFWDRRTSVRNVIVEQISVGVLSEWVTNFYIGRLGYSGFSWSHYFSDTSLTYTDYPDRLAWPKPTGNDFIHVGSVCNEYKALPKDLEEFVNDPKSQGTIYIAFGSIIDWDFAPKRVVDAYLDAANNMTNYRVIWSYKGNPLDIKSHVRLMAWAPQNDLLHHPKTKLFVSHGGLKSVKEAICSATPVVYMPFFAEQTRSSLIAKQLGFAEYLNKMTVNADEIITQMNKVLQNDNYHKQIQKRKDLFVDRVMNPLQEGVFWTEKILKYNDRPVLFKRTGIMLYWLQFVYFDSLFVFLVVLLFVGSK